MFSNVFSSVMTRVFLQVLSPNPYAINDDNINATYFGTQCGAQSQSRHARDIRTVIRTKTKKKR